MSVVVRGSATWRHRRPRLVGTVLIVARLAFGLGLGFQLLGTASTQAAELSALTHAGSNQLEKAAANHRAKAEADPCLEGLPVPTPMNGAHRVVQMVNCSKETLLGASTAAFRFGNPKTPVLSREHTWVMEPVGSPDHKNVLTIDIPEAWENTKVEGSVGPILWARTGCRYDIASDRAQCETGGSSGKYDVSRALLGPSAAATIVEWTFYEQVCSTANDCANSSIKYFKDSPDISAVNGVNLNVDLEPLGGDAHNPFDALTIEPDPGWLNSNIPLTIHGEDLRAHSRCQPENFQVKRSDLTSGTYAFVIVGDDGKVKGPNTTVACLSNCARYEYPNVPTGPPVRGVPSAADYCDPTDQSSQCYRWKTFCCPLGGAYDQLCANPPGSQTLDDKLCDVTPPVPNTSQELPFPPYTNGAFHGGCWVRGLPTDPLPKPRCSCRAFIRENDCPADVCTHPFATDPGAQPPFGHCSDVSSDPTACIGDDTIHKVMRKVYTWPNDPQVYGADAPAYRIIFAAGGTNVPITPAGSIPLCGDRSDLPKIYGYDTQYHGANDNTGPCGIPVNREHAVFAVAKPHATEQNPWACSLTTGGAGDEGVICRWIGVTSHHNSAASSLHLKVPAGVQNADLLLASITFDSVAAPMPPSGWALVPNANATSSSNAQTAVWDHIATGEPGGYTWHWSTTADPAGGMTAWRGVDTTNPFDVTAAAATGAGAKATAPSITTVTAFSELISVFGGGNANSQEFTAPNDEDGEVSVIGGPVSGTWFAHLVAAKLQREAGATSPEAASVTSGDWTAISIALKTLPH